MEVHVCGVGGVAEVTVDHEVYESGLDFWRDEIWDDEKACLCQMSPYIAERGLTW